MSLALFNVKAGLKHGLRILSVIGISAKKTLKNAVWQVKSRFLSCETPSKTGNGCFK